MSLKLIAFITSTLLIYGCASYLPHNSLPEQTIIAVENEEQDEDACPGEWVNATNADKLTDDFPRHLPPEVMEMLKMK